MKHKKLLLVVFFLTLFIFQQAQASANLSLKENKANDLPQSKLSSLPTQRYITMLHLDDNGARISFAATCTYGDTSFGCAELGGYPYQDNPVWVDVENDYLLDVLPREMNVAENKPSTLDALQAQALAARSLADWKFRYVGNSTYMDNSRDYQVFIPYAYEYYAPDAMTLISSAVTSTSGQYLSYGGEAIDAEFGSDMYGSSDNEGSKDYLIGIQDPISTSCGAWNNSNRWGMSQLGAYRWSRGNQCATDSGGDEPWPVKWEDYRQILVHYYTGIDILNATGGKVAPDDRWNLLNYNLPNTTAIAGTNFTVNVTLQNTSTTDWTTDRFCLSFYARRRISPLGAG